MCVLIPSSRLVLVCNECDNGTHGKSTLLLYLCICVRGCWSIRVPHLCIKFHGRGHVLHEHTSMLHLPIFDSRSPNRIDYLDKLPWLWGSTHILIYFPPEAEARCSRACGTGTKFRHWISSIELWNSDKCCRKNRARHQQRCSKSWHLVHRTIFFFAILSQNPLFWPNSQHNSLGHGDIRFEQSGCMGVLLLQQRTKRMSNKVKFNKNGSCESCPLSDKMT